VVGDKVLLKRETLIAQAISPNQILSTTLPLFLPCFGFDISSRVFGMESTSKTEELSAFLQMSIPI